MQQGDLREESIGLLVHEGLATRAHVEFCDFAWVRVWVLYRSDLQYQVLEYQVSVYLIFEYLYNVDRTIDRYQPQLLRRPKD